MNHSSSASENLSKGTIVIPKIFHKTAKTKLLTGEEERLSKRLSKLFPEWQVHLWDDADNEILFAQAFPQYIETYRKIRRGVIKADIARCTYLYVFGGVYLDTDYKVLRPFDQELVGHSAVLPISRGGDITSTSFRLGNAFLASEPGFSFWKDFIDNIFTHDDLPDLAEDKIEVVTGPEGLTNYFLQNYTGDERIYLPERRLFHPELRFGGLSFDRSKLPYCVHLCWGSWRSKGFAQNLKNLAVRKITSYVP